MLFCILLLTTTPVFSDLAAITALFSGEALSSRERDRAERCEPCRASRAAPSTSESACGRADRSAPALSRRARPRRGRAVLRPSLHLLLREPRRELRQDGELRRGELHRFPRVLLTDALHLEQHAPGTDDGHPLFGRAFALAHTRFLRLLGD